MVHGDSAEDTSTHMPGIHYLKGQCWDARIDVLGAGIESPLHVRSTQRRSQPARAGHSIGLGQFASSGQAQLARFATGITPMPPLPLPN